MFLYSKKLALFTVCALSLSTVAPMLCAGDVAKPAAATKLTPEQNNKLNTALKIVGGVVVVAALGAAVYGVSRGVRAQSRLSGSSPRSDESKRGAASRA